MTWAMSRLMFEAILNLAGVIAIYLTVPSICYFFNTSCSPTKPMDFAA